MDKEKIDLYFNEMRNILAAYFDRDACELDGIDEIKEKWEKSKSYLFQYFDCDGRVAEEIKLEAKDVSREQLKEMLNNLKTHVQKLLDKNGFTSYTANTIISTLYRLFEWFPIEEIIKNKCLDGGEINGYPVTKNMKISKFIMNYPYFSSYIPGYDQLSINEQNKLKNIMATTYSILLNRVNSKNVTVVLSINPLDFLFVSEHTTGWTSCHNFREGGYKTGGFSYMLDPVSLVGYAYINESPYNIYGYTTEINLPIKLWREMVFLDINHGSAFMSRQYPGDNPLFAKTLRRLTADLLSKHYNVPRNWKVKFINGYPSMNGDNEDYDDNLNAIEYYNTSSYNYRDPISSIIKLKEVGSVPNVCIGSKEIICPICGIYRSDSRSDCLACKECTHEYEYYCYRCGDGLYEDDVYWAEDEAYCESCFEELFVYCEDCDEVTRKRYAYYMGNGKYVCENCIESYIYCDHCCEYYDIDEGVYIEDINEYYCIDCAERYAYQCKECGKWFKNEFEYIEDIDEYYCTDCAERYAYLCKGCGKWFKDEIEYIEDTNEYYCTDCAEELFPESLEFSEDRSIENEPCEVKV